jgi:hypothetical protein
VRNTGSVPNTEEVYHDVISMLRQPSRVTLLFIVVVIVVWASGIFMLARAAGAIESGDGYNVPLWIARNLAVAWLNRPARAMGGGVAPATDEQLLEFFSRASAVGAAETDLAYSRATGASTDAAEKDFLSRLAAAQSLARPVQLRLAAELTQVGVQNGLATSAPGFQHVHFLWPPVNFAYDLPPYLLVRSPRSKIELTGSKLLRSDLSESHSKQIVRAAEAGGDSALVVRVGGIATYPSIVEEDDDYTSGLELIAHEWTHQYLAFHPLGVRYFQTRELTTINETVANIIGHELALTMRQRFPLPGQPTRASSSAPGPDRLVDFDRTMHELRLDVDRLLAEGDEAGAEQRMNDTRQFLVDHGYYVPTINQAYFAFYGSYANTAASTSPIGPQLARLRARYPTLGGFVRAVQDLRSDADLRALLNTSGR